MQGPNGSTQGGESVSDREVEDGPEPRTHLSALDRAELAEAKAMIDRAGSELARINVEAQSLQLRRQLAEAEHHKALAVLQERRARVIASYGLSERDAIDLVSGAIQRVPPAAEAHN